MELCFAVVLPAIASGIVFNIGASTGGTEIVAMILHKYIKVEIGRALLLSDIVRCCLRSTSTAVDREYCVLGLIGRSTIVDTAIESLNLRKVYRPPPQDRSPSGISLRKHWDARPPSRTPPACTPASPAP